jgi:hypothetical protein
VCKRVPFSWEASLSPVSYVEICTNLERFKMARIVNGIGFGVITPPAGATSRSRGRRHCRCCRSVIVARLCAVEVRRAYTWCRRAINPAQERRTVQHAVSSQAQTVLRRNIDISSSALCLREPGKQYRCEGLVVREVSYPQQNWR